MLINQATSENDKDLPKLSVVIVGRDGIASLRPILLCLAGQTIAKDIELIAVLPQDRCRPETLSPWETSFRGTRAVSVATIGNRGRAAASGVWVTTAPIIAFTENHCFPDPDWAEALVRAHDGSHAGVAPVVLNANPESLLGWAIYSSGYAEFSDRAEPQEIPEMPLHNTSYCRNPLAALGNELEELLSHESRLQQRLRDNGHKFFLTPAAKTRHINEATWKLVLGLNYCNGRRYGGHRALGWGWSRRIAYAALFPFLSVNVARKALQRLDNCGSDRPPMSAGLLLAIWLQSLAHAAGEAVGYLRGPRDEFDFVDKEEFMILERLAGARLTDPRIADFVSHAVTLEDRT